MSPEKYSSVERWFEDVFSSGIRSKSTEKTYLHFLGRYSKFVGMTPDELINARRQDLRSTELFIQRQHEELLIKWRNHLEEKEGLARGSIVTANNIIKSFYKANYAPLILKAPKSWKTRIRTVPTPEELGLIVEKGCRNNRDKAITMCLSQSGVSLEDFLALITYEKIKDEFERGIEPLHLPMERTKIKKTYDTFFGTNAIEYLTRYLKEVKPKPNRPIFTISARGVEYIVERASKRVQLDPHVTPHKLRAFFNTYMVLSFHGGDVKHIPIVEYWMGHVIPYKGAYLVPPVDSPEGSETPSQRKLYKEHEWAVSIPP